MIWKSEGEAPHPDATCLRLYSCYKFTFIYAVDQGCHVVDILYIWKHSPPFSFRLFCLLNRCLWVSNYLSFNTNVSGQIQDSPPTVNGKARQDQYSTLKNYQFSTKSYSSLHRPKYCVFKSSQTLVFKCHLAFIEFYKIEFVFLKF